MGGFGGIAGMIGVTPDKKSGLSMMNPSMRKMAAGKSILGGAKSTASKTRSQGTRMTGSRSRTSKAETNYEEMNIDELDVLIEEGEREMQRAKTEINKIKRNKGIPTNQKAAKMEPFEDALKQLRFRIAYFL